jgi:surface polysaccharide O-acyltransferase-like enzyme
MALESFILWFVFAIIVLIIFFAFLRNIITGHKKGEMKWGRSTIYKETTPKTFKNNMIYDSILALMLLIFGIVLMINAILCIT